MDSDASIGHLSVSSALQDTALAWDAFIKLVDSAPADRANEPGVCGDWSLKILVGHVAFWDGYEANRLATGSDVEETDFQPLNVQNAAETAARSYAEVRAELDENHARAIAAISANPVVSPEAVRELLDDHYVEHGREIEAWLAKG